MSQLLRLDNVLYAGLVSHSNGALNMADDYTRDTIAIIEAHGLHWSKGDIVVGMTTLNLHGNRMQLALYLDQVYFFTTSCTRDQARMLTCLVKQL